MWNTIGQILTVGWLPTVGTALIAYLLGSFNSAIIVSRLMGRGDIRNYGSGNAGATNMLRSQGKLPALLTTVGDLLKSFVAVVVGEYLMGNFVSGGFDPSLLRDFGAYLGGVCCIMGHLYPLYFGFRGGKGVMATLGMMLVLDWRVALLGLAVFGVVVLLSRMVSLGSCCAGVALVVLTYVFRKYVDRQDPAEVTFCTLVLAALVTFLILKHLPNIRRIIHGTENRISFGKKTDDADRT